MVELNQNDNEVHLGANEMINHIPEHGSIADQQEIYDYYRSLMDSKAK